MRWNVGTIAAGTPNAGTVTITARAGAVTGGTGTPPQQTFTNNATLVGTDAGGTPFATTRERHRASSRRSPLTLGKSVDKTFIGSLPSTVTYTLTPRSDSGDSLDNVHVIDPFPTGLTPPPTAVGQGGTYGPYVPIPGRSRPRRRPADPRHRDDGRERRRVAGRRP